MEALIHKFDGIRLAVEDNRRKYSDPGPLRAQTSTAPFVVVEPSGSTSDLDMTLAAPEQEEGDDRLVRAEEVDDAHALSALIEEGDIEESGTERVLVNTKRDVNYVSLDDAIQFWISYQNKGVDITKVSDVKGNARGFYNASRLREIMKGIGLRATAKDSKPMLTKEIKEFHSTNEEAITAAMQARRNKTDIQMDLGDGAIPPPDSADEEITEIIDEETASSGSPPAP